jgi:hypothetical protein
VRTPARRIDDEVGGEGALLGAVRSDPHARDATVGRGADQPDGRGVANTHVGEGEDPGSYAILEERPRAQHPAQPERGLPLAVPGEDGADLAGGVQADRSVVDEGLGEPGEQLVENLQSARVQDVDVASLRNAAARAGQADDRIPVDQGDSVVVLGEYPRGQQAGDARAQDEGVGRLRSRGVVHGLPPEVLPGERAPAGA